MTELNKPIKERRFHKAMLGLKEKNERSQKRIGELTEELYECNLLKKAGIEVERQFYKDIRYLEKKRDTLFDAVKHGDEKHRAWLKKAIEDHFKKEEE